MVRINCPKTFGGNSSQCASGPHRSRTGESMVPTKLNSSAALTTLSPNSWPPTGDKPAFGLGLEVFLREVSEIGGIKETLDATCGECRLRPESRTRNIPRRARPSVVPLRTQLRMRVRAAQTISGRCSRRYYSFRFEYGRYAPRFQGCSTPASRRHRTTRRAIPDAGLDCFQWLPRRTHGTNFRRIGR